MVDARIAVQPDARPGIAPQTPGRNGLIAGLILSIALTGLIAFAIFENFSAGIERKTLDDLAAIGQAKQIQIEGYLQERRADAEFFSRQDHVWQFLDRAASTPPQALSRMARQLRDSYGYRDIQLLDPSLRSRFSFLDNPLQAVELAALTTVVKTRRMALVDMHVSKEGGVDFGIAAPVFAAGDPAQRLIGVVYLESDAGASLFPRLAQWPLRTVSNESLLLRRDGPDAFIILSPVRHQPSAQPLSIRRSLANPGLVAAQALSANRPVSMRGIDYRGIAVFAATAPILETNWFLVAKIDQDEIATPVHVLGAGIVLVALLLAALLTMAARLLWQRRTASLRAVQTTLSNRYEAARQASIDAYVVTDKRGIILEVNAATLNMTGYTLKELLRGPIHAIDVSLTTEQYDKGWKTIQQAGGDRWRSTWRTRDGNILNVEISTTYVAGPEGGSAHSFVHDIGPQLAAERRIERLTAFNVFLSHVNTAIFNLREMQQILDVVCAGAVRDGGFILAWAGVVDEAAGRIVPVVAHGAARDYVAKLVITTDPALPTSQGPTRLCMVEQRIVCTDDFQNDSRTNAWHEIGRAHGIQASAAVPIVVDGKAIAAITFYSGSKNYFDAEFQTLLEEAGRNVSLAIEATAAISDRDIARSAHRMSEDRFQRAFDVSPVPLQIHSIATRKLLSINQAHERTFGYALADIADEATWFERVFPDPAFRQRIKAQWDADVMRCRDDPGTSVVESPEITLRCKDGGERVVRGFMSIAGDDIIIEWDDLTDIKRSQALLADNERNFRGMVEQTLVGVYVGLDGKFAYANPRFCEIVGRGRDELLGLSTLDFLAASENDKQQILDARSRLHAGQRSVEFSLPFRCQDGTEIELGLHASLGVWERREAFMVMVQDITERKRADARIATYVKQLEGTMRGTLQAVANMVDMRDPYTAGHERRVGVIAADIAREMGWPEDKCQSLELIGLVHDIGKIGVPSEILSKPGKLTHLEYQIVQAHAEKGYEILKNVEFPLPIAEIIREHHERMDGSGYPQGLKGDAILPEARVLAVADVFESMSSHRPYRPALGVDAAVREIEGHRGTWFDANVVDALLRLLRDNGYRIPD